MTTDNDRHRLLSVEYLDAMQTAWSVVKDLHRAGVPLPRLVWQARNLYHAAWKDELRRARGQTC